MEYLEVITLWVIALCEMGRVAMNAFHLRQSSKALEYQRTANEIHGKVKDAYLMQMQRREAEKKNEED